MERRREGWSGRTGGRDVRLSVRGRGRGTSLLVDLGYGARAEGGARIRGGAFGRRQDALLDHHWPGAVEHRGPVGRFSLLLLANEKAAIRLFNLAVDNVGDALKLAGRIYT